MSRRRRRIVGAIAIVCGALAVALAIVGPAPAQTQQPVAGTATTAAAARAASGSVARGRSLFEQGCSDCHGLDAHGVAGVAPDLHGVGALSADFYLRTGRMPLANPTQQPVRTEPAYSSREIADLDAYVGSLGGPPIPQVDTAAASLSRGLELFTENCAGCHQIVGRGGIVPGAVIPDLQDSKPVDVAEAVRVGPYVMPRFPQLSDADVAALANYVQYTHDPVDRGGWGIGHIGPIPEGMVAWLLAGVALLLTIRLIGERTTE